MSEDKADNNLKMSSALTRRDFLRLSLLAGAVLAVDINIACAEASDNIGEEKMTEVFMIKTQDREKGTAELLKHFDLSSFAGKSVALKPNYNSADDFPASTHIDSLRAFIRGLKGAGVDKITLPERSGMGVTRSVLENRGVMALSKELGFEVIVLDELGEERWIKFTPEGSHWRRGFLLAKPFQEADKVVQLCCLKTHRYGGHFTMSLKNSVGAVAKYDPTDSYNYMNELHSSRYQRYMIAEINQAYNPEIIVMDGIKAFVTGGPASGREVEPGVIIAGNDRVAVDAVGVAILRHFGTTPEVSRGKIFEQEQIARAVELGIGVKSAKNIKLVTIGEETQDFAKRIEDVLKQG